MNSCWNRSYFFEQGIYFKCQKCGLCCSGTPGVIRVTLEEISQISDYIKISSDELLRSYLYPYQNRYSIREREDGACYFYENGCRIYPVRPVQCKTYPFWFNNLRSEKNWQKAIKACPGIGKGVLYSKEQILTLLNQPI